MSTRPGIRLSTENFVCCSRSAKFCACKISRCFADHPSKILLSKIDKFDTDFTVIIQTLDRPTARETDREYRRNRTSSQNWIHFAIKCHWENHSSTSIKYRGFQKKYKKYMLVGILFIKLKTTYSHESHHYGGCNQSLTSRPSK